ncbi:AAA family ATPase [Microbispora sp. NPDC049125]|uniref:ATP-binding protein n=1 Tax=Microbispora sp. NPDC049125 TaxID=3154929 RepID=UPI00346752C7
MGMLYGRAAEQSVIESLLSDCREGRSGCLLVRGDPGIGKTALLDHAAATAAGDLPVLRATGIESEAELPFAGLHLLLRPVLDRLDALPEPQSRALRAAFGLAPAEAGDRLLVGLAVLSLLSELGPLLCLVDDAHWLDRASAEALLFAARRLDAEGVALVFAAREHFSAPGVPELRLHGIDAPSAAALLGGGLSPSLRYRVLAEARGNPLALIELPGALRDEPLDEPLDGVPLPLTERVSAAFLYRVQGLPERTQAMLALASADDTGDLALLLRAAARLDAGLRDLAPAETAGLVRIEGDTVTFRHPLARAAVYQGEPPSMRLAVHRALADALTEPADADRRIWHLAMSATGPDEEIAAELERTAVRASSRAGYAAAASAYERAARLSADGGPARARRLTLAAESALAAGQLDRAAELAGHARLRVRQADDDELNARLAHVGATADFLRGALHTAHQTLLDVADTASGPQAARMLLQALHSAWYIGGDELERTTALLEALDLPAEHPVGPVVRFVVAVSRRQGPSPSLTEVVARTRSLGAEAPRDLVQLCGLGLAAGQDAETAEVAAELIAESRARGGVGALPTLLFFLAETELFHGRHADALATGSEALRIAQDTDQRQWASQLNGFLACLAALRGDEALARRHAADALGDTVGDVPAAGAPWATWAMGLLDLGHGRAEAALTRLETLTEMHMVATARSVPDMVEAAVRLGRPERVLTTFAQYEEWARFCGQPWLDALVLRCRALLSDDDTEPDELFAAALDLPGRPFERARTQLLLGERLRRTRRKAEARPHLRAALETFERLDATPWADRARTELGATGSATPDRHEPGALATLTPQELQIVRLAARGLSNRDIAAQLFLSPRTVAHHLYKAYPKLGVVSRRELADFT